MKNKNEINKLWLASLPTFKLYSGTKLYRILGPFVIGIELIKLPRVEEYRPHFVIYSLYGNDLGKDFKSCMKYPLFMMEFGDKKNLQYSISCQDFLSESRDAIENVKKTLPFILSDSIKIGTLYKFLDSRINNKDVIYEVKHPEYFEMKYYLGLYKSKEEAEIILKQILLDSKGWDMNDINSYFKNFDDWINALRAVDREKFIGTIEVNKSDNKFKKIEEGALIIE